MVNNVVTTSKVLGASCLTTALLEAFFLKDNLTSGDQGIPNSDNLTRIVEVRDLMQGQGWFDLMQYRLGVAPGVEMHWSRLVDLPIAALVWFGNLFSTGQGEVFAGYIWPVIIIFLALSAILYGFRRVSDDVPLLPACVIGAFSLMGGGVFTPQSFDHHNIQTALALWCVALLLPGPNSVRNHILAATLAAAMLAIGMETLPYVIGAGLFVALTLLVNGNSAKSARAFGLSLAASITALFVGLVGPSHYLNNACDAFSSFHLVSASAGGLGLAILAQICLTARSYRFRLIGLAALAIIVGIVVVCLFPHCLGDPLASLDPRLKKFWLDDVIEAQSIVKIIGRDPSMLFGLFGLPLVALVVSLLAIRANFHRTAHCLFALMLTAALLVTCWQMRGALFGLPFAAMPLALWVARLSVAVETGRATGANKSRPLLLLGAWVVSISMFWGLAGSLAAKALGSGPTLVQMAAAANPLEHCYAPELFAPLNAEPDGTILGATSLGALVLKYTNFRTLTGPYHRNSAGNLAWIEAMTGTPDAAKAIMSHGQVSILAICSNGADEGDFLAAAPGGFLKQLLDGHNFSWLEPVNSSSGNPLRFWRVKI